MSKVAVFGAGSWGTAFSLVLTDAGNDVTIWGRREEVCAEMNSKHENNEYLPKVRLPDAMRATHDPAAAAADADLVFFAVPSQTLRENLTDWAPALPHGAVFVSLMAGMECGSSRRMSEVIGEVTGAGPERIAVVSGPSCAREIAQREPAAGVISCADEGVARRVQGHCHSPAFRPYVSTDVIGCEIGGAYSDVVGLAVGMAVGLGFGLNTTASVVTRGLAEAARLATAEGADPLTLMGLAGLGGLVSTCSSPLSPNRSFGERLGRGATAEEICASAQRDAEGVRSCSSLLELARRSGIESPLVEHVDGVVRGDISPRDLVAALTSRGLRHELD